MFFSGGFADSDEVDSSLNCLLDSDSLIGLLGMNTEDIMADVAVEEGVAADKGVAAEDGVEDGVSAEEGIATSMEEGVATHVEGSLAKTPVNCLPSAAEKRVPRIKSASTAASVLISSKVPKHPLIQVLEESTEWVPTTPDQRHTAVFFYKKGNLTTIPSNISEIQYISANGMVAGKAKVVGRLRKSTWKSSIKDAKIFTPTPGMLALLEQSEGKRTLSNNAQERKRKLHSKRPDEDKGTGEGDNGACEGGNGVCEEDKGVDQGDKGPDEGVKDPDEDNSQNELHEIKTKYEKLSATNAKLSSYNIRLVKSFNALQNDFTQLQTAMTKLKAEKENVQSAMTKLKAEKEDVQEAMTKLKAEKENVHVTSPPKPSGPQASPMAFGSPTKMIPSPNKLFGSPSRLNETSPARPEKARKTLNY